MSFYVMQKASLLVACYFLLAAHYIFVYRMLWKYNINYESIIKNDKEHDWNCLN